MSHSPFSGYDAWLEKPFQDALDDAERFESYWAQYGSKITETIDKAILDTMPEGIKDGVLDVLLPKVREIHEEILAEWAHHIDETIPDYPDWCENRDTPPEPEIEPFRN